MSAPPERTTPATNAAPESFEQLLKDGPFCAALRAAILARGLSLDRIQDRLARRGVTISVATLSYWQSGQRRPERPASLRALRHLEAILGVPPDALGAVLAATDRRNQRELIEAAPPITDLWPGNADISALMDGVPTETDTWLRRLSQHDRVTIGSDGRMRSMHCTQLMRAERDEADRFLFLFDWEGQGHSPPLVTGLRNCRLGEIVFNTMKGLFGGELRFERPLRRGETVLIEYEFVDPARARPTRQPHHSYSRRFGRPIREFVLEICFDEQAPPRACQLFTGQLDDTEPRVVRNLRMGVSNTVLAVGRDFGPGCFGISWRLPH